MCVVRFLIPVVDTLYKLERLFSFPYSNCNNVGTVTSNSADSNVISKILGIASPRRVCIKKTASLAWL